MTTVHLDRRLFIRVIGLCIGLVLLWGLAIPAYVLLDPVALPAAQTSSAVAGVVVLLGTIRLMMARLRRPSLATFAYLMARDFAVMIFLVTLIRWWVDGQRVEIPYFENFSLLGLQFSTGLSAALAIYFWGRRVVRRKDPEGADRALPGLRTIFTLNGVLLALITATALGFGLSARSAGLIDHKQNSELHRMADLLAGALLLESDPQRQRQLLQHVQPAMDYELDLLTGEERPVFLMNAKVASHQERRIFGMAIDGERRHFARRPVNHHTLWLSTPANVRPPVRSSEDIPALLILAALALFAPLTAWLVSHDLRSELGYVASGLRALGPDRRLGQAGELLSEPQIHNLGVPLHNNDEVGDLAAELNTACWQFIQEQQRLRADLEGAARNAQAQSLFLQAASIELQAPLANIKDNCQALKPLAANESQSEDIRVIADACEQLENHIAEILQLAKLDDWSEAPLNYEHVDLGRLATDVFNALLDRASPGLKTELAISTDVPNIECDPMRIRQVLENLIGNALKFTTAGYVRVTLGCGELSDGRDGVHIQVWDTGPGIPDAEKDAIFSEFYRVSDQRTVSGTGLGLAISAKLIERHNGNLWVESIVGEGSTFHLLLPRSRS